MERGIIIIPDVHGRTFWRRAVEENPERLTVFLGDYLDPYRSEGIGPEEAREILREIIALKKERQDGIVLLLGNHDLGYLDREICSCRTDRKGERENRDILADNIDLFDLAHVEKAGGISFLFTHAGIGKRWFERNATLFGGAFDPEAFNAMLHDRSAWPLLFPALAEASWYRGGFSPTGSPVWADVSEFLRGEPLLDGWFHVFGHTLHEGGPIAIGKKGACLDCRIPFALTEDPLRIEPI